ncbi:FG-GAP repeat domain-containing protein [Novipirellula artificiosorum]|uniref:FG-GAP repeat protein n=1 Tax=Novipirellula artificiosorum TaxID=2528016 RepID=A0A5C6D5C9_9BACT|nr:VCBS repeat-containing protein [Novipirellula artificiosorum]TWU32008.1 FG-GAP repeat protein [Novipirellula artificiosorum]
MKRTFPALLWLLTAIPHGLCRAEERAFVSSDRLTLGTEMSRSASLRAADVDGDADIDLIVANGRHWPQQNFVFVNQGRSRFNVMRPLGVDRSTSYACEPADFDGDGHVDWVVSNVDAANLVFLGDGNGGVLTQKSFGRADGKTYCVDVADFNRDGLPDIVVGNVGQPNAVYFNGDLETAFDESLFGAADSATYGLCTSDFNGDGFPDIAVANSDGFNRVFLNQAKDNP